MEIPKKRLRGFHSQEASNQLEVVKPFWVARNFIPSSMHKKCQGHHGLSKIPSINHFLKKAQIKLYTEQSIQREQHHSDLDYWRSCGNNSQYDSLLQKQFEENHRRESNKNHNNNISTVGEDQIKSWQNSIFKGNNRRLTDGNINNELKSEYQYLKLKKNDSQGKNSYRGSLPSLQKMTNMSNMTNMTNKNGQYLLDPLLSEIKDPNLRLFKDKFQQLKGQESIQLIKQRSNKSPNTRFPSIVVRQQLSFSHHTPSQSSTINYDKTSLLEQYKQTVKIFQAILQRKQKAISADSKKIMNVIATLQILKEDLAARNVRVFLDQYMSHNDCKTVEEIQKLLHKNSQYQEVVKELKQKIHGSNLVTKMIKRIDNQSHLEAINKKQDKKKRGENILIQNKENTSSIDGSVKKHFRYLSDGPLDQKKMKNTQNGINTNRKQTQRDVEIRKIKHAKKQQTREKRIKNIQPPNILKKGRKHNENKLPNHFINMKNQNNNKLGYNIQIIDFNKQKLQEIQVKNKINARRPGSHKNHGQILKKSSFSYKASSQKEFKTSNEKKTLRISFMNFLKMHSQGNSKRTSKVIAKFDSYFTTPPELINQIQDNLFDNIKHTDNKQQLILKGQSHYSQNHLSQNSQLIHKSKKKVKINRFHHDMYQDINIHHHSSEWEIQSEYSQDQTRSRNQNSIYGDTKTDWDGIVRRVAKKKTKRKTCKINQKIQPKSLRRMIVTTKVMEALHHQVYRILQERAIPEFQQIRKILLQNLKKIQQVRLKQNYIQSNGFGSQQEWIQRLDFEINLQTNHRQHLGDMKSHNPIMIRKDTENDQLDLYQIACRESNAVDKIQEKQRLDMFAKESVHFVQKKQLDQEVVSYGF